MTAQMETLIETAREAVARQLPRGAVPAAASARAAAAAAAAAAYPAMNTNSHPDAHSNLNHGSRSSMAAPNGSQESCVSAASSSSSAAAAVAPPPRLQSSQSNLSSASAPETELTSPTVSSQSNGFVAVNHLAGACDGQTRPVTPGADDARVHFPDATAGTGSATTSPMAIDSQTLAQGSKRTASGAVKMASKPAFARSQGLSSHSRNPSLDSNMSRIGELSAELKTRLAYAMVKVQNGWEQKSIGEVETIASQRCTPMLQTPTCANYRSTTDSPTRRRTSSYDDSEYMASPGMTDSPGLTRALNGHAAAYHNPDSRPTTSSTVTSLAPSLAPAVDIIPQRRPRRSLTNHARPILGSAARPSNDPTRYTSTSTINAPTTPTANKIRPPGILRLPSQQAEMDAVDSLLFMSSPNNSAGFKHTASQNSTAQPSPLRAEFAGAVGVKRVAFDERSRSISSSSVGESEEGGGTPLKRVKADG